MGVYFHYFIGIHSPYLLNGIFLSIMPNFRNRIKFTQKFFGMSFGNYIHQFTKSIVQKSHIIFLFTIFLLYFYTKLFFNSYPKI